MYPDLSSSGAGLENSNESTEREREGEGRGHDAPSENQTPPVAAPRTDNGDCSSDLESSAFSAVAVHGSEEGEREDGLGSKEGSLSSMGDDWVNLSHSSHPLVTSTD